MLEFDTRFSQPAKYFRLYFYLNMEGRNVAVCFLFYFLISSQCAIVNASSVAMVRFLSKQENLLSLNNAKIVANKLKKLDFSCVEFESVLVEKTKLYISKELLLELFKCFIQSSGGPSSLHVYA